MEQVKIGCGIGSFRAVGQKVGWVNLESGTGDSLTNIEVLLLMMRVVWRSEARGTEVSSSSCELVKLVFPS